MTDPPRIVAAVLTAVHAENNPALQVALEDAMTQATEQALAEGVSVYDGEEIQRRKAIAYDEVMEAYGG